MDSPGDLEFPVGGASHALFVYGEGHHSSAVLRDRGEDPPEALSAVFQVDGVHYRPPRELLERRPNDLGLGAVHHQGGGHRLGQELHQRPHLVGLVGALGQRHADVKEVGAGLHLGPGDLGYALVVVGEKEILHLSRPLGVDPLADEGGRGSLRQVGGGDGAGASRSLGRRSPGGRQSPDSPHDGANVVGGGATAPTHHGNAEVGDELVVGLGKGLRA